MADMLANLPQELPHDKFMFLTTPYKNVLGHSITVDVCYLKALLFQAQESNPILVRYHGGALMSGSSLFPQFFAPWHFELAERHSALIVTPNYRLLPESSLDDIFDDLDSFWLWLQQSMLDFVAQQTGNALRPDLNRIMTAGDSAGGYLSIHSGLRYPESIRVVTAAYPGVDMTHEHFTGETYKTAFGLEPLPQETFPNYVQSLKRASGHITPVSDDPSLERAPLMFATVQWGQMGNYFTETRPEFLPLELLRNGKRFPRGGIVVWHGLQDSMVPVEGSRKLMRMVKELDPELPSKLVLQDGEHGFDLSAKLNDPWMITALSDAVATWLKLDN